MKKELQVVKSAAPLFLEGTNKRAVLIIHGYTGYPGEFYELAQLVHKEGFTVSLPRLPGHGTNKEDFLSTGWKNWLDHISNAYMDLRANYESVSIVGLSMGGVLNLILAARFDPERIVLLAPAMAFHDKVFYFTPLIRLFLREIPKKEIKQEINEDRKILQKGYWALNYPGQVAEMYKLIRIAKRELTNIDCPALVIVSEKDEAVSLEASKIIKEGIRSTQKKEIVLKESGHVLVTDKEKETVFKHVIDWLNKKGEK